MWLEEVDRASMILGYTLRQVLYVYTSSFYCHQQHPWNPSDFIQYVSFTWSPSLLHNSTLLLSRHTCTTFRTQHHLFFLPLGGIGIGSTLKYPSDQLPHFFQVSDPLDETHLTNLFNILFIFPSILILFTPQNNCQVNTVILILNEETNSTQLGNGSRHTYAQCRPNLEYRFVQL